jgi:hypothetical protein
MDMTSTTPSVSDLKINPRIRIKATGHCGTVVALDEEPNTENPEIIVWITEDGESNDWPTAYEISEIEIENKGNISQ